MGYPLDLQPFFHTRTSSHRGLGVKSCENCTAMVSFPLLRAPDASGSCSYVHVPQLLASLLPSQLRNTVPTPRSLSRSRSMVPRVSHAEEYRQIVSRAVEQLLHRQ